jgi:putative SOS response-associated peptidase YedK
LPTPSGIAAASSRPPAITNESRHQPSPRDESVLPFAGLWDEWHDPESGQQMGSARSANVLTWPIHDRMLVVFENFEL